LHRNIAPVAPQYCTCCTAVLHLLHRSTAPVAPQYCTCCTAVLHLLHRSIAPVAPQYRTCCTAVLHLLHRNIAPVAPQCLSSSLCKRLLDEKILVRGTRGAGERGLTKHVLPLLASPWDLLVSLQVIKSLQTLARQRGDRGYEVALSLQDRGDRARGYKGERGLTKHREVLSALPC
jgi:hypothetical protein